MADVDVIILHPLAAEDAGRLERGLADARATLAERHRRGFLAAGAQTARIHTGLPDGRPFGLRLRELLEDHLPGRGLVLLGSGALPLATDPDRRAFVAAAGAAGAAALANNRFSADVVALTGAALAALARVPADLPSDNGLPRWLAEVAGVPVTDLRARWRLAVDLDSPLDVLLVEQARGHPQRGPSTPADSPIVSALDGIRAVMVDPTAELIVAGRTSAGTVAWLERNARCRVRSLIEERGLRASSRLAVGHGAGSKARPARPARSILGMILDRDGPEALGDRLAELGDAALIDSRVLMAHRLGVDESSWPTAESRFASDLLEVAAVDDPWLAALTASAFEAAIPIVLGGHSLVGPGVRLVARGR